MTKILFVCHGNICRSPMAEFVMKDLVKKAGLENQFHIESAATSTEEIGNPVYPPARRLARAWYRRLAKQPASLRKRGLRAVPTPDGMDRAKSAKLCTASAAADFDGKWHLLMEIFFTDRPGDVADSLYTDDFETTGRSGQWMPARLLGWLMTGSDRGDRKMSERIKKQRR